MWGHSKRAEEQPSRSVEARLECLEYAVVLIARAVMRDQNELASLEALLKGAPRALSATTVTTVKR
jgi:hypothetical protein